MLLTYVSISIATRDKLTIGNNDATQKLHIYALFPLESLVVVSVIRCMYVHMVSTL